MSAAQGFIAHFFACQFQGTPNWLNHSRIDSHFGALGVQIVVKRLTHQRRTREDTSGHGHLYDAGMREEAANHSAGKPGQFSSRPSSLYRYRTDT